MKQLTVNQLMQDAFADPLRQKEISISAHQRGIIYLVMNENIHYSYELAAHQGITLSSASTILRQLHIRGWLQREEQTATTGGTYHKYTCNPKKWGVK